MTASTAVLALTVHAHRRFTTCAVEGLGYLHRAGMLHGNLKPSNLLVWGNARK
jgi:serine/threonine protein kinase